MPLLSVIIATHNRPNLLEKCLQSLVSQPMNKKQTEIVVVDNSKQKTAKLITKKFPNLRYIHENKIGLSIARNTGFKKAHGEYVAYIDDDSIAGHDWLREIHRLIKRKPEIEAFGGSYSRHTSKKTPFWFPSTYGTLSNGNKFKKLSIGLEWLSGTNMIFRKKLLQKFKGFNPKLGMSGRKIHYGEETDLLIRLSLSEIDIYYSPKLKVSHLLARRKINFIFLIRDSFRRGIATTQIKKLHPHLFKNLPHGKSTKKQINNLAQQFINCLQLASYGLGKIYAKIK